MRAGTNNETLISRLKPIFGKSRATDARNYKVMQGSKENRKGLSRRQEQALLALMDGASLSLADVARKISVHESTIWRWMNRDEAFMRAYRDMRRASVERGVARVQSLFDKAVDCLEANLTSGNRPSEVRSAVSIIRQSLEGVDVYDFDERISNIEKRFDMPKGE